MESIKSFYFAVTLLMSFTLLIKTSFSSGALQPSEGPSNEVNSAPTPLSTYEIYLSNCASKLKPNCGKQVFFNVFFGNETVSDKCCVSLVKDMGKSCHLDITKFAVQ